MDIYAAPRSRPLRRHSVDVSGLRGFIADAPPETSTPMGPIGWGRVVLVNLLGLAVLVCGGYALWVLS